jgi:hypothetical protein
LFHDLIDHSGQRNRTERGYKDETSLPIEITFMHVLSKHLLEVLLPAGSDQKEREDHEDESSTETAGVNEEGLGVPIKKGGQDHRHLDHEGPEAFYPVALHV